MCVAEALGNTELISLGLALFEQWPCRQHIQCSSTAVAATDVGSCMLWGTQPER